MKTILLLLITATCYGQMYFIDRPDIKIQGDTILILKDNSFINYYDSLECEVRYDTSKILMLVSDTAQIIRYEENLPWVPDNATEKEMKEAEKYYSVDTLYFGYNEAVWWQYGYEVKRSVETGVVIFEMLEHFMYLDPNKNKLSDNIVIWQIK